MPSMGNITSVVCVSKCYILKKCMDKMDKYHGGVMGIDYQKPTSEMDVVESKF